MRPKTTTGSARRATWTLAAALAGGACASVAPLDLIQSTGAGAVDSMGLTRQRDAAMRVVSSHYGETPTFDRAGALASARHAARVYEDVDVIRAELGPVVRLVPVVTAITGLQYYVVDESDRQVVAVRGTRPLEIRNWVATAVVLGTADEVLGFDVHEGFLIAARILEASLLTQLDRRRPVHLTGHSLGGSLVTLIGLRLDRRGYDVSVTTFGAPKITTFAAFANEPVLHDLDLTRVVNEGDVVHHFPTLMDASGRRVYAHFGHEWTLGADGSCEPTNLAASLTKSAALVLDRNLPDWSIDEHDMDTYLARLEDLPSKSPQPIRCQPAGRKFPHDLRDFR